MELDTIITNLNKKMVSQGVSVEKLAPNNLTIAEKAFMEEYKPETKLIVYGTLAPNKPNHYKIEHIKGNWLKAIVKGALVKEGWAADLGYFAFKHSPVDEQKNITAYILLSGELVDNWHYLDEFEGDGYKRILAKYELENGAIGVGNIYAINDTKR